MGQFAQTADDETAYGLARDWLRELSDALEAQAPQQITRLFLEDGCWRDVVVLTGDVRSFSGASGLAEAAARCVRILTPGSLAIRSDWPPAAVNRAGRNVIEVLFRFETGSGSGDGVV